MSIRPEALAFGPKANDYEKGRPDYPPGAVSWLVDALRITSSSTVVDLAAGTGKLTRALLATGARVIAVEPVAGMRDVLTSVVPAAEVLEGTAEQLPLPDSSAGAVTVAQAFHWFRGAEALAEIHRVLAPHGRLGLIWNRRNMDQPVQAELARIMKDHRGDTPSQETGAWKAAFQETRLFGPLTEADFSMEQIVDREQLVARVLSVSFMAGLPADQQAGVADEVTEIAGRFGDPVTLRYTTRVYWCEARAQS
ncbi:MAG TPA: class I SAM-dependent methyltransferase [Acidimicrobiales bacterium]|nr:class I SAM-dependent methyltransferase [Acidimicrobiales bacterium]